MAIKLKNAKTTAAGASAIFAALSGVGLAFSKIPADSITTTQLIAFGAMAIANIAAGVGLVLAPDNSAVSVAVAETRAAPEPKPAFASQPQRYGR